MGTEHPKLRPIEVLPVQRGKQSAIGLRDPQQIAEQMVTVSTGAILILRCLDGEHSVLDIQTEVARATGEIVPREHLERFIQQLDEALLLESPRFAQFHADLTRRFRESPVREPSHAGRSYPADPQEIAALFDQHFQPPKGPGPDGRRSGPPPVAIMAPHIDLRIGGPGFAWAYGLVRDLPHVDTFLILGVAHAPTTHRFVGTRKSFRTPLGTAETDQAILDALAQPLPFDLFEDELAHRLEHSVEFQVVYLQHVLGPQRPFKIVPILVGSFGAAIESGQEPIQDPEVAAFVQALQKLQWESGSHTCVVAGVDLAHVGGRFGDEFTVNQEVLAQLERDDRQTLEIARTGNAQRLFEQIHEEQDCRRVDGFAALYTMLSALLIHGGEMLYYDQSVEPDTNSVVTYGSMCWW